MQKEVEIKIRIGNAADAISILEKAGCVFSTPLRQEDAVFVNYDGDFLRFPKDANFLRIRRTDKGALFTLKRGEELDSIERETQISDPEQMKDALEFMGYHEAVRVIKIRRKAKLGEYEFCVDDVDGLGAFLEVEKITSEDSAVVQEEMILMVKMMGIAVEERVRSGYDTLMYMKLKSKQL